MPVCKAKLTYVAKETISCIFAVNLRRLQVRFSCTYMSHVYNTFVAKVPRYSYLILYA
ncbi:hypothetical protein Mapa_017101 [Marchantia paleacea]|nr:hypothetical protein Mapa_017101 [Marchantia paleacea]